MFSGKAKRKFVYLLGSLLNDIFKLKSQSSVLTKSLFRVETERLVSFKTEKKKYPLQII